MKRLAPRNTAERWRSLRHSETEPWSRSALRHARISLPGPPLPGERWVTGVTVLAPPLTMPAPRPQRLEPSLSLSGLWLPSVREWTRHPWGPFSGGTLFAHLWVYYTPGPGLAKLVSGLQGTGKEGETQGEKGQGAHSGFRCKQVPVPACYHGKHREASGRPEERPRVWLTPSYRSW